MVLNYIILCISFYLIGSIPTSYLFVKWKTGKNIINEGSGNSGAMNSYDVSKSKLVGISVFITDFLKGALPALFVSQILKIPLSLSLLPFVLLILGHNYSIWLKFKGGRGLAPGAGFCLVVNFWLLIIWCVVFLIFFLIKRNVHIGNIAATILLPLIIIIPSDFIVKYNYDFYFKNISDFQDSFSALFTFISSVCILILIKHMNPLINLIKQYRKNESQSAVKNN